MLQLVEFEKLFTLRLKFIESMYVLLCFLWGLLVWSVAGGAISRIIALRLTRDDSITLFDSIAHGKRSWLSHLIAPLIPVLAILVIAGFMALFALIGRIPGGFGPFVYSLFLPLWLLGGLILTVLFLGVFMSWPLMWPAVGTECCDAFDALGRAYGYLFSRPLKYLLYFIISIILGFISYFLIGTFVELSVDYTASVSSWGTSDAVIEALNHEEGKAWITVDDKTEEQEIAPTGSKIYKFWLGLLMIIPVAYGYSYFWAAAGNIYLLLRFEEDGTEMDEVYVEDEQYSYSLPPTEAPSSAPGANGNQAENPAGDEKPAE